MATFDCVSFIALSISKKTGWKQWCRSSGSSSETYWRPHRQKEPRHLSCSISICRSSSIQCLFDFFQSLVYHSVSFPLQVCTWRRRGLHCRLGGVYRPAKRNNGSSNGQIWWQLLRPGWMLRGDKAVVLSALSGQSTLAAWVTADIGWESLPFPWRLRNLGKHQNKQTQNSSAMFWHFPSYNQVKAVWYRTWRLPSSRPTPDAQKMRGVYGRFTYKSPQFMVNVGK